MTLALHLQFGAKVLEFNGPVDMVFWYRDDMYYLSEVNPRFGGTYLHAYDAGVNFIPLIENNINGIKNGKNIATTTKISS